MIIDLSLFFFFFPLNIYQMIARGCHSIQLLGFLESNSLFYVSKVLPETLRLLHATKCLI